MPSFYMHSRLYFLAVAHHHVHSVLGDQQEWCVADWHNTCRHIKFAGRGG